MWSKLNAWAMSDEETDEENNSRVFRTLPWRKEEVTHLIRRCDEGLGMHRVYGLPSERLPNKECKEFVKEEL